MAKAARGASTGRGRPPENAGESASADGPPAIDRVLGELEQVVEELESGDLPLERALERFEVGVGLARDGNRMLSAVEERVEVLLADRDEAVPFQEAEQGDDDEEV